MAEIAKRDGNLTRSHSIEEAEIQSRAKRRQEEQRTSPAVATPRS